MDYNTERPPLLLMEYGRNVQKLVEYIANLDDKEKRTAYSHTLIHLMKVLNPAVRENSDNPQRIWDHMHVMSDFNLDIDGPYPNPDRESLNNPPQRMEYRSNEIKFRNYGRNIELLVEKAMNMEEELERFSAFVHIGRLVKTFYSSWHKESIEDKVIISQLKELSNGTVDLTEAWEASGETLFNSPASSGNNQGSNHHHHNSNKGHSNRRGSSNNRRRGRSRRK